MRFTVATLVALALGLCVSSTDAAALVSLDQGPIVRVLRISDVPESSTDQLPSGALTAAQFVLSNDATASSQRAEERLLRKDGFKSSAISGYNGPGDLRLKSTAIEFDSPRQAAAALAPLATLSVRNQSPGGTPTTSAPDRSFSHAIALSFHPNPKGATGGVELLATAGSYLYTLQGIDKPDYVSLQTIERLLKTVMARG